MIYIYIIIYIILYIYIIISNPHNSNPDTNHGSSAGALGCNMRCHYTLLRYIIHDSLLTVVIKRVHMYVMCEYITAFKKKSSCDYQY